MGGGWGGARRYLGFAGARVLNSSMSEFLFCNASSGISKYVRNDNSDAVFPSPPDSSVTDGARSDFRFY